MVGVVLYIFLCKLNDASIYIFLLVYFIKLIFQLWIQINTICWSMKLWTIQNEMKFSCEIWFPEGGGLIKLCDKVVWWNSTSYLCKFIFVIHFSFFVHSHDLLLLRIIYSWLHHHIIAKIQFILKMESKNVKETRNDCYAMI